MGQVVAKSGVGVSLAGAVSGGRDPGSVASGWLRVVGGSFFFFF